MARNPYQTFGRTATNAILSETQRMPADVRAAFLQTALNALNSQLYDQVTRKAKLAVGAGAPSATALRQAMESSLADGLMRKTIQVGLLDKGYQDLGLFGVSWSDVGKVAGGIAFPPSLLVTTSTGRSIASSVLKKVQEAACMATSSGVGQLAAGGAAAYAGAPPQAGIQGAQTVSSLTCPPPAVVPGLGVPFKSLLLPAVLAGGLIVAAVVITR
jgi:hypothetical protein